MKSLIIVESPAKAKTIEKFLGKKYQVKASKGHIRDLPKSQFGVEVEKGFEPKYITIRGKGETLKELKDAMKKADHVYLATDPDREGEAISWHLAESLGIKEGAAVRIVFHEITKEAIQKAVQKPRPIDARLVDAQQARRILDRVVGYKLSPLLWRKIRRGLSAGRVQSVAVRLIVDRERERRAFQSEEYWTVEALFSKKGGETVRGRLVTEEGKRPVLPDKASVDRALVGMDPKSPFQVADVTKKGRTRYPAAPFTTSTLQQEASRRLGFSVKKTMSIAQVLYEGVDTPGGRMGVVTYIRTDATRVGDEAKREAEQFIGATYGKEYARPAVRKEAERPGVQGAHEAIRPTSLSYPPGALKGGVTPDQMKLYRLIWDRFLSSQMSPARLEVTTAAIIQGKTAFRASGTVVVFPGFLSVYEESQEARVAKGPMDEPDEAEGRMPSLEVGESLGLSELNPEQHFTEPPPRYSEAMLVKTLEEKGIGRPSTYAPIIQTIQDRGYVLREDKRFLPTELGELVVDLLQQHFPQVVDPDFTAELEEKLDGIEEGRDAWRDVLASFYEPFENDLKRAEAEIGHIPIKDEETDVVCERCGRNMVIKIGRFGKFLACPGFPECKNTKPLLEKTGVSCPDCGQGEVVERRTKTGRRFYGCSRYPECRFTSWQRPSGRPCPECGQGHLVEKRQRGKAPMLACSRTECSYVEEMGAVPSEV